MRVNRPGEPGYTGLGTFCKLPLVLDPAELAGVDVAVLGAPFDETVSHRPGARFGPRAVRMAEDSAGVPPERPHMLLGVDPFAILNVVDYGDAETVSGDPARSHAAVKALVAEVCGAGASPIVIGGDHSVAHPNLTAIAEHHGPGTVGVIQFDAHTDTATDLGGVVRSHGTPMRLVVDEGSIRGDMFVQVGLRGWWPGEEEFGWMREVGFRWYTAYELDERGLRLCLDEVIGAARDWDKVFLSVDIDSLDPAFAPGTGTPEPGGLTPRELLYAVRRIARELPLVGMELVEVAPMYDSHANVTAITGHRVILEALSGMALRRAGIDAAPQLDGRTLR
jgi:agmatinase